MQYALSLPREMSMPDLIDRNVRHLTVQSGIWIEEIGWLHRQFKSPNNISPTFRFPDLFRASVAVAMYLPDGHALVLGQARLNPQTRATRSRRLEC